MRKLALSATVSVLLGTACGSPNDVSLLPDEEPAAITCRFDNPTVTPHNGAGPLHRTTPIRVTWLGEAGTVDVRVWAGKLLMPGQIIREDQAATFVPLLPYPADAVTQWRVRACERELRGAFAVGALKRPLADVDDALGHEPFNIDLRRAVWESPVATNPFGELVLRWLVAPGFLVQLVHADADDATFAIAPGVVDDEGTIRQDLTQPVQTVKTWMNTNPYVALYPQELELALGDGAVTLERTELVLGLTGSGFDDGRLVTEVRVPGAMPNRPERTRLVPGAPLLELDAGWPVDALDPDRLPGDPCRLLATVSDETCHACADGEGRCFTLVMSGLEGMPSKVRDLVPMPLGEAELPFRGTVDAENPLPTVDVPTRVPRPPREPIGPITPPR